VNVKATDYNPLKKGVVVDCLQVNLLDYCTSSFGNDDRFNSQEYSQKFSPSVKNTGNQDFSYQSPRNVTPDRQRNTMQGHQSSSRLFTSESFGLLYILRILSCVAYIFLLESFGELYNCLILS
jgi:hypothetical protein